MLEHISYSKVTCDKYKRALKRISGLANLSNLTVQVHKYDVSLCSVQYLHLLLNLTFNYFIDIDVTVLAKFITSMVI